MKKIKRFIFKIQRSKVIGFIFVVAISNEGYNEEVEEVLVLK